MVKKRPYAHPITRQDQPSAPDIPKRDGELPIQVARKVIAILLIEVHDHLGVAVRRKRMPALFEEASQLYVIEYLTIERHPHLAILVCQRLGTAGNIDDAKSRMAQAAATIDITASAIRTTMVNTLHHTVHLCCCRRPSTRKRHYSRDTAHTPPSQAWWLA